MTKLHTQGVAVRRLLSVAAALALTLGAVAAQAQIGQAKRLGVGLGGGTLTSGLSGKYYLSPTSAVQAVVGSRFGWGLSAGADYIVEFPALAEGSAGRLFWGAGAGAGLVLYDAGGKSGAVIGVAGVIELGWHFKAFPLELVTDWRPTFFIGDALSGLWLGGGGGAVRWYF
jgi:hypothetical protein